MADQLIQLITTAKLMGRAEGVTIKELKTELGISERTAYRLICKVEESGFPVYDDREGHGKVWRLNWGEGRGWNVPMPSTSLTPEEHAVLGVLLSHLNSVPLLANWSQSLLKKLQYLGAYGGSFWGTNGPALEFSQSDLSKVSKPEDAAYLSVIFSAINEKHTCTVTYKSPKEATSKQYPVYPLCCFAACGGMYLYCVTQSKGCEHLIMLAIERIQQLEDDGKALFMPERSYDVKSLLEDPFGIILDDEWTECNVLLDARQGWYETQKVWPPSFVSFTKRDDGLWVFHIRTRGFFSLILWLLSCAGHVKGISDRKVRESYRKILETQLSELKD